MNTDEVRLVKNIIMNIGSVMDATEFTTMHPITRETVTVVPIFPSFNSDKYSA